MAKSLDELIDFLLEEVALSGERGLKFADVAAAVGRFYHPEQETLNDSLDNEKAAEPKDPSPFSYDRAFLEKVWKWLGRHSDVSIGLNHEYDTTVLADLEREYPRLVSSLPSRNGGHNPDAPPSQVEECPEKPSERLGEDVVASQQPADPVLDERHEGPSVYVTEDRMYIAICGHLPDPTRVFPTEWQLLSYIAAARHNGILQGDLTRMSKQDKRSVPKRTDALQAKGYIEKRPAYVKGNKTSRLILRRYLVDSKNGLASGSSYSSWVPEKLSIKYQARQMFDLLKNNPLTAQEDLAKALGMEGYGRNRVLSQIIKHFGRVGCLKRVKTAFGPSASSSDLKICIQWLREPVESDWTSTGDDDVDFGKSVTELADIFDAANSGQVDNTITEAIENSDAADEQFSNASRTIPQWNPDRILANVFFEASKLSGTKGLTNLEARRYVSGILMRRVIESHLMKISHHSLQSQPAGLKHLAILRSKQNINGIGVYYHHAFDKFVDMVAKGEIKWTDVGGGEQYLKQIQKQGSNGVHDGYINVERDRFGLPIRSRPSLQVRNGEASLTDIVSGNAPDDIGIMNDEPILRETDLGQVELDVQRHFKRLHVRKEVVTGPKRIVKTGRGMRTFTKRNDDDEIPIGRPRRFVRGTEKFWRNMFMLAKVQVNPGFKRSQSAGLMSDPAGLRLFHERPSDFDDVLVMALSAHLPVPREPREINDDWIRATRTVLDRCDDGLYLTFPGTQGGLKGRLSQVMILKSSRLHEVDFNDRDAVWDWQIISSSAAHSSAYRRYYPRLVPESRQLPVSTSLSPARKRRTTPQSSGPPRGLFYEDVAEPPITLTQVMKPPPLPPNVSYKDGDRDLDETDSDPDIDALLNKWTRPVEEVRAQRSIRKRVASGETPDFNVRTLPQPAPTPPAQTSVRRDRSSTRSTVDRFQGFRSERPSPLRNVSTPPVRFDVPDQTQILENTEPAGRLDSVTNPATSSQIQTEVDLPVQTVMVTEAPTQDRVSSSSELQIMIPSREIQVTHEKQADFPINDRTEASTELDTVGRTEQGDHHISSPAQEDRNAAQTDLGSTDLSGHATIPSNPPVRNQTPVEATAAATEVALASEAKPKENVTVAASAAGSKKRGRNVVLDSDEESDTGPPSKRRQTSDKMRPVITKHCRSIIIDLIDLCSGLAPLDQATFRRAMIARWHESGVPTKPPSSKIVRTGLHALANSSTLTQITFAFRSKKGNMITRSIIARRDFNVASEEVIALQHKMIEADEEDYIPPELKAEEDRIQSALSKPRPTIEVSGTEDNAKATKPSKKGRLTNKSHIVSRRGSTPPPSISSGFLTLSVPQIASLNLPNGYQPRHTIPTQSLVSAMSSTTEVAPKLHNTRASRPRRKRTSRFDPETHTIVWQQPRTIPLPTSLEDFPNIRLVRDEIALAEQLDPDFARFEAEIECVAAWEEKFAEAFDEEGSDLIFINHTVTTTSFVSTTSNSYQFRALVTYDDDQKEIETELPEEQSWPPFTDALRKAEFGSIRRSGTPQPRQKRKRRGKKDNDDDAILDDEPLPKRRKRRAIKPTKVRRGRGRENGAAPYARRIQAIRYVPLELRYRIILAVVVVRVLSGGIEKFIDWNLVSRLVPGQEAEYLQNVWKSLLNKYRADAWNLTENLQEHYIEALVNRQVPTVNYHDITATDWEGIMDWAMKSLDKFSVNKVDDIPATREEFDNQNKCSFTEHADYRDMLGYGVSITQPKKEEFVSGIVFGTALSATGTPQRYEAPELSIPSEEDNKDEIIARARSWIMAILFTEESSYDPVRARTKLLRLAPTPIECEKIAQKAVKSLQRDKMLSRARCTSREPPRLDSDELYGVRTWSISNKFSDTLGFRRQINAEMLQIAAKYKLDVLDGPFSRHEPVIIPKGTALDDGDMVCILNLQSQGLIKIQSGPDKPDTRYGLDWENTGYTTKLIDKSALGFSIIISSIRNTYMIGDPTLPRRHMVPIPRGEIDRRDDLGRIPMWFDINHTLRPDLWHMFLVAVLGLISIRPGVDDKELCRSVLGMISLWEVKMIVLYLESIGAIKRTIGGSGWETREWWWMCIGADVVVGGGGGGDGGGGGGDGNDINGNGNDNDSNEGREGGGEVEGGGEAS